MSRAPEMDNLIAAIKEIEPSARFVTIRALRRALRAARDDGQIQPHAIHDRVWRVDREQLFRLLTPGELGLSPAETLTELVLLPAPAANVTRQDWVVLWRALFHAAVDREVDAAISAGRIDGRLISAIATTHGPATWHTIRSVLREENLINDSDSDALVFREFAAFALELVHFAPDAWAAFFPGINPQLLRIIRAKVDSELIFERTRPRSLPAEHQTHPDAAAHAGSNEPPSDAVRLKIADWTENGNVLRAAIHLSRAGDPTARDHLHRLIDQLCGVLRVGSTERRRWQDAFEPLLAKAAMGGWPRERRLLYELQRAYLAVHRPTYSADLVDWIVTLGRRPAKRLLTLPRWLIALRRLRAAERYAEQLGEAAADDGVHLLKQAVEVAERNARAALRPQILAALDSVALTPNSVAEKLSREKLVEELLDTACARGFLRIGDLRDAIARNRVKLPDLSGPGEFFTGDPLLRADREIDSRLDGVYRRGEFYMRALQRGCSLFFGTVPGRLLTKYVVLPFGGAFLLLEAVHHMIAAAKDLVDWLTGWTATVKVFGLVTGAAAQSVAENPTLETGGFGWPAIATLGVFLFLILHWPAFREQITQAATYFFIRLPRVIRRSELVNALFSNWATRIFRRYLWMPMAAGALSAIAIRFATEDGTAIGLVAGGTALLAGTFFRTPIGREAEDRVNEAAERIWRVISVNFALGLLSLVMQFFRAVFEAIDRGIHAVDEWLRFREGESRASFAFKMSMGAVWFVVSYLFRFAWNLLVEPQINPIKHFPVVTVSHKMLLPLIPSLATQFRLSTETTGLLVSGVPGIFGFLVWELKENWKLYRANASPTVRPAIVGPHGERVRALLRPGFHSGVVPKTFARLRKAVRKGNDRSAVRQLHALDHLAEAVHRLAERELVAYLNESHRWSRLSIRAEHPVLTPNRILIPLVLDRGSVVVTFEELGGWIIASLVETGGLDALTAHQRGAFADALLGLYKRAGINITREHAANELGRSAYSFDAVTEGIVVCSSDGSERLIAPTGESDRLFLSDFPLEWSDWVERWESDAAGKAPNNPLLDYSVMPIDNLEDRSAPMFPPGSFHPNQEPADRDAN